MQVSRSPASTVVVTRDHGTRERGNGRNASVPWPDPTPPNSTTDGDRPSGLACVELSSFVGVGGSLTGWAACGRWLCQCTTSDLQMALLRGLQDYKACVWAASHFTAERVDREPWRGACPAHELPVVCSPRVASREEPNKLAGDESRLFTGCLRFFPSGSSLAILSALGRAVRLCSCSSAAVACRPAVPSTTAVELLYT